MNYKPNLKRILVACEESQIVTKAFREGGINALSCDILDCSGGKPEWHIRTDVLQILNQKWDMILAFPPCTHLSTSGARWFPEKIKDGRQQQAIDFFMKFANADCDLIAIENPIGIMSTRYRKPDQIIQPWQFGHPESKATCLWLKNLPTLVPTDVLQKPISGKWENQMPSGQNRLGESASRAILRSKTYQGIANAMATQWTPFCIF